MINERKPTISSMMTAKNFSMNLKTINLLNQGLKRNERNLNCFWCCKIVCMALTVKHFIEIVFCWINMC